MGNSGFNVLARALSHVTLAKGDERGSGGRAVRGIFFLLQFFKALNSPQKDGFGLGEHHQRQFTFQLARGFLIMFYTHIVNTSSHLDEQSKSRIVIANELAHSFLLVDQNEDVLSIDSVSRVGVGVEDALDRRRKMEDERRSQEKLIVKGLR